MHYLDEILNNKTIIIQMQYLKKYIVEVWREYFKFKIKNSVWIS